MRLSICTGFWILRYIPAGKFSKTAVFVLVAQWLGDVALRCTR
jgi:hypothetical protein